MMMKAKDLFLVLYFSSDFGYFFHSPAQDVAVSLLFGPAFQI